MNLNRPIVLIGLPGSGKSSVGRVLEQEFGWQCADLDEQIQKTYGNSIPQIFQAIGEPGFRCLEASCLKQSLDDFFKDSITAPYAPMVIASGGGMPTHEPNHKLLGITNVVYLRVKPTVAVDRIENSSIERPLLPDNPLERMEDLARQRCAIYEELADLVIDVDDLSTAQIAKLIAQSEPGGYANTSSSCRSIWVNTTDPYPVIVGKDLDSELEQYLPKDCSKVMLFHSPPLRQRAQQVKKVFNKLGRIQVFCQELPDGEACKNTQTLEYCWHLLSQAGLGRKDLIVALGGGALTDLAGFAASSWLRGICVVHMPTSLLAMVDAAIGGKTGIDLPAGKNMVGAFHCPRVVICDLNNLISLPDKELRSGMVEALKCGYIRDSKILELSSDCGADIFTYQRKDQDKNNGIHPGLEQIITRAIAVKAQVVSQDLRESSLREILNYGHTFGHAIEKVEKFSWKHGQAVGIGMIYAAHLGALLDIGPDDLPEQIRSTLQQWSLPVSYGAAPWDDLFAAMNSDKKVRGGRLRFVLLKDLGQPETYEIQDIDAMRQAARLIGVKD